MSFGKGTATLKNYDLLHSRRACTAAEARNPFSIILAPYIVIAPRRDLRTRLKRLYYINC